jgi:hypothetical protein
MPKIAQELMGRIITTLAITNRLDEGIAERGLMAHDEVRSITLDDVLVDTGATTLCLPSNIIGREGTFECLELPGGRSSLLGVIPLEALGIELDLQNQIFKTLPISPTQTYLTIMRVD